MLSIGKLAAGQARYYLDQAEGRVDVVESVGDGVEDYYVGGTEAGGRWMVPARSLKRDESSASTSAAERAAVRATLRRGPPRCRSMSMEA